MIVSDERGLLSGLVVAELARERLLVEMDDFVVNLQRLVRLKLLPASLAHVHLYSFKLSTTPKKVGNKHIKSQYR